MMTSRFDGTEKAVRIPDALLEKLGDFYRRLCSQQGNGILMRGGQVITFEQFVAHQHFAEVYRSRRRIAA